MFLAIGYFAELSAPDVRPVNLMVAEGHFATRNEAVAHARSTADRLHAHSFIINFPDGAAERQLQNGEVWKCKDNQRPPKIRYFREFKKESL